MQRLSVVSGFICAFQRKSNRPAGGWSELTGKLEPPRSDSKERARTATGPFVIISCSGRGSYSNRVWDRQCKLSYAQDQFGILRVIAIYTRRRVDRDHQPYIAAVAFHGGSG